MVKPGTHIGYTIQPGKRGNGKRLDASTVEAVYPFKEAYKTNKPPSVTPDPFTGYDQASNVVHGVSDIGS